MASAHRTRNRIPLQVHIQPRLKRDTARLLRAKGISFSEHVAKLMTRYLSRHTAA